MENEKEINNPNFRFRFYRNTAMQLQVIFFTYPEFCKNGPIPQPQRATSKSVKPLTCFINLEGQRECEALQTCTAHLQYLQK